FKDFWTVPGYLGANPPESLARARVQYRTIIQKVMRDEAAQAGGASPGKEGGAARGAADTAFRQLLGTLVQLQVTSAPTGNLDGAVLIVKSGAAAGKALPIRGVAGDVITIGSATGYGGADAQVMRSIQAGDQAQIDNSDFLAAQYYH